MHHFINVKKVSPGVIDIFIGDDEEDVKDGNVEAVRKTERPVITECRNTGNVTFVCGDVSEELQGIKNLFYEGESLTDPRSEEYKNFESKMDEIFNQ